MPRALVVVLIIVGIIVIGVVIALWPRQAVAPEAAHETSDWQASPAMNVQRALPSPTATVLRAVDIAGVAPAYTFSVTLPSGWQGEAVPAIEAVNFFDPAAAGETALEKSQIFVRHFRASDFLTLDTVTIHERTALTLNGRPAVRYDIEKKAAVADFPSQPSWRNLRHIVTDIRVSDGDPSEFYVIAKRPELEDAIYEALVQSLQVVAPPASLQEPIAELASRVTKKSFGTFVTPDNSPVQPERFTGYHNAVDVEYGDIAGDVLVRAIADGTVVVSRTADGYGGVVAIQHTIDNQPMIAIYGHLDQTSMIRDGATVAAGEQIGILGDGGTPETDGERKHLHFGLLPGTTVDLRGYVQDKSELSAWRDPLMLFK